MSDNVVIIESNTAPKIIELNTTPASVEILVPSAPNLIELVSPGPQGPSGPEGPVGPQGPTGAPGGVFFRYDNNTPNGTWVVSHNLGRVPNVQVFSTTGELIYPDLVVTSQTITVTFGAATAGFLMAV